MSITLYKHKVAFRKNDGTFVQTDLMEGDGTFSITVDDELSSTSENPVRNKVIKAALDAKAPASVAYDSGWVYPTLNSAFNAYSDAEKPRYRKVGSVVELIGSVAPKTTWDSTVETTIFTLPTGFRTSHYIRQVCQGSGAAIWLFSIKSSGEVTAMRYRISTVSDAVPPDVWMPFHITFTV